MIRRPPRSTRTDTLFPYTTLFRSAPRVTTPRRLAVNRDDIGCLVAQRLDPGRKAGFEQLGIKPVNDIIKGVMGWYPVRKRQKTAQKIEPGLSPQPDLDKIYRQEERRVGKECGRTCKLWWSPLP